MSDAEDTVLLVDDNPTNLEVLYQTLDGQGYRLLAARGGEAALAIIHETKPTLILLDIMMPGMDGFQVCERLKSNPATADIAVIFLSALGDTDTKVRGFELGAVDYISKPFQAAEIVARVATHVKIRRLERELSHRNIELEREITRILATMQEGVFGVDVNANITYANRAAAYLSGWDQDELVGQPALTNQLRGADGAPRSTQTSPYSRVFSEGHSGGIKPTSALPSTVPRCWRTARFAVRSSYFATSPSACRRSWSYRKPGWNCKSSVSAWHISSA